jgi:hypothetical protein
MQGCSFSSKTPVLPASLPAGKSFKAVRTSNDLKAFKLNKRGWAQSLEREQVVRPMEATCVNQRWISWPSGVGVRQSLIAQK